MKLSNITSDLNMDIKIPKQLPKGVKESEIKANGEKAATVMNTVVIVQICI